MVIRPAGMRERSFYFILSLVIAAVVASGFSQTVDKNLLHPSIPVPHILYFHAAIFTAWVLLFILQTALIRTRQVRLHRQVGACGLALGVTLVIVGVATAIAMARFRTQHGSTNAASFLAIPLYDMVQFAIFFGLAIAWRKTPEFHRRLMFVATCGLAAAAFGRLIPDDAPDQLVYVGADALILLGAGRDWLVGKRLNPVYLYGLPGIIAGQSIAMYLYLGKGSIWLSIAHKLID